MYNPSEPPLFSGESSSMNSPISAPTVPLHQQQNEMRARMASKGGLLNRGSEHVTIRTNTVPAKKSAQPGSLDDERQYPRDRFGNRLPDDLPATYYKRRGLQEPPPFAYKYQREDELPGKAEPPPQSKASSSPPPQTVRQTPIRPPPSTQTSVSSSTLPPSMPPSLAKLKNTNLSVSDLVHLASLSNPPASITQLCASITLGLAPGSKKQQATSWPTTQRSLIRASDLLSRIRCFNPEMAPAWRLECLNGFVLPQGLLRFYSEWEGIGNEAAKKGAGKLFLWCFNLCDKEKLYSENNLPAHESGKTGNNSVEIDEEVTTSNAHKDDVTRQSLQEAITPPGTPPTNDRPRSSPAVTTMAAVTNNSSDLIKKFPPPRHPPPQQPPPQKADETKPKAKKFPPPSHPPPKKSSKPAPPQPQPRGSLTVDTTAAAAVDLEDAELQTRARVKKKSPGASSSGGDSVTSSLGDLDALQSNLYGSSRSNTPSPNSLALDLEGMSRSSSASMTGSYSARSSSDEESTSLEEFRVQLKTDKLKIGLVGLDKLLAKTPRQSARKEEGKMFHVEAEAKAERQKEGTAAGSSNALFQFFVEKCKLAEAKASEFASNLQEEEIEDVQDLLELLSDEAEFKEVLKEAGCKRVHVAKIKNQVDLMAKPNLLLQQWMSFSIPELDVDVGVSANMGAKNAKSSEKAEARRRDDELKSLSKESEVSVGSGAGSESSGSNGGWMESPGTSSRTSSSVASSTKKSSSNREKYRDYSDDSSFDSDASYETDTDEDNDSSEDSEDTDETDDSLVVQEMSAKKMKKKEEDAEEARGRVKFKPPTGPPPGRKANLIKPPPSKPPQAAARGGKRGDPKKSLLEAARSRMSDPHTVHGDGVRKFI
ncbi:hypothetical protein TrST_g3455 [Triparma strigata]|uniref:Uncharacterized protein n=1 Tax=Triparma strigata TaxID=1606541 RepID=A0A9W7EYB1_9STRA|nr:hypothetical protein TrST_g3455 [Triparma strigata]